MKSSSGWAAFAALALAVVSFSAAGGFDRTAEAQSVDNKTTRWLAATVSYGESQQAMMLFDSQTNRLMAYTVSPMKELELIAAREISYDLKLVTYGKQKPTVQQVKDDWEKSEREERERNEKKK